MLVYCSVLGLQNNFVLGLESKSIGRPKIGLPYILKEQIKITAALKGSNYLSLFR